MTIELSLPKAYQEIHPLCNSIGKPINCMPTGDREGNTVASISFHNGRAEHRESQYLTLSVPTEARRITDLGEFVEAFRLLVDQTSPDLLLQDIQDEIEEVLSWFT